MRRYPLWLCIYSGATALVLAYGFLGGIVFPALPDEDYWWMLAALLGWVAVYAAWKCYDDLTGWRKVGRKGIYEFYVNKKDLKFRRYSRVEVQAMSRINAEWLSGKSDVLETDDGVDQPVIT